MAITATTNSVAIGANDVTVAVAATTGITAPNFQTGTGITILLVDQEYMLVVSVNTTSKIVGVVRGINGSAAVAHVINGQVQIGVPSDFQHVNEQFVAAIVTRLKIGSQFLPATFLAGSADALDGSAGYFVVKTAGVDAITLVTPTATMEGNVIDIWSDTTNAHTVTAATACVAAGQALKTVVTFPAFRGAGCQLIARNLVWHLTNNGGVAAAGSCTLS